MKRLALISDVHGNDEALTAVFEKIDSLKVDDIYCLGDLVNPFPDSEKTWERVQSKGIPILKGNHEDYMLRVLKGDESDPVKTDINFRPVTTTAESLSQKVIEEIENLDFDDVITFESDRLYLCHASPISNAKSYIDFWTLLQETRIKQLPFNYFVAGHSHIPSQRWLSSKMIWGVGSVGLSSASPNEASFSIIEDQGGRLTIEHFFVPYDATVTAHKYKESGFFDKGLPMSLLIFDELISGSKRLSPFFEWMYVTKRQNKKDEDWEINIREFLNSIDRWEDLTRHFNY